MCLQIDLRPLFEANQKILLRLPPEGVHLFGDDIGKIIRDPLRKLGNDLNVVGTDLLLELPKESLLRRLSLIYPPLGKLPGIFDITSMRDKKFTFLRIFRREYDCRNIGTIPASFLHLLLFFPKQALSFYKANLWYI